MTLDEDLEDAARAAVIAVRLPRRSGGRGPG